ncbi:HDOD domain-containing protein [Anoxynatronum buryatiense]|uniref:Stage 0 sporulation protein A homolog n=1 Tax=Anoxynatronum buryatiense TaxID=489973 RepID=A0AA45WWA9_9CLOT|nr:HDOD domain-containing protein [Anoxynatronum buryatiense]SMP58606.1 Response regulator receiver domain-containing protein [Anoxynatronum buryatiense]
MKRTLLLVDDERQVIRSLERLLMDTDYRVLSALSAQQGLEILEKETINLVMSDMRMPEMDGYEFLNIVKERYPHVIRIMLTGYSEENVVLKALEDNTVKVYLFKPWKNEELMETLRQIFETYDLLNSSQLLEIINNASFLPTIEDAYWEIIRAMDHESDLSKIASYIEKDSAIASKVLRLANSAYYGARTGSLHKAVTYIGLKHTRHLVRSTAIIGFFQGSHHARSLMQRLWKQAALSHRLYHHLYQHHLNHKMPENNIPAALLHNIGVMFLLGHFGEGYATLLLQADEKKLALEECERQAYGNTHMEAGGYLLSWWNFPFPVVEAALYHHAPFDHRVINTEVTAAVHLVNRYSHQLLGFPQYDGYDDRVFDYLGVNQQHFEKSLESISLEEEA